MPKVRRSRRLRKPPRSLEEEYERSEDSSPTNTQGSNDNNDDDNQNHEDSDSISEVALGTPLSVPKQSSRELRMRKRRGTGADEADNFPVELPDPKRSRRGNKNDLPEDEDEEVTAIKFNTGVLYLYRGRKPRAEFVWKR